MLFFANLQYSLLMFFYLRKKLGYFEIAFE
jgi:hypothetical protein